MKSWTFALLLVAALSAGCQTMSECCDDGACANPHLGKVRHVVLFKFKDGTSPEQVAAIEKAFANLKKEIKEIRDYEWGVNNSPEGLNQGLTHCFLVTFDTTADRDAYLPHPAHLKFVEMLKPSLDKATVVDFIAKAD